MIVADGAAAQDLVTIADVKRAIEECRTVYIGVRFGCTKHYVIITKVEARAFVTYLDPDASPSSYEMRNERFGELYLNGDLYLG